MSHQVKWECLRLMHQRYRQASRPERTPLLTECSRVCQVCFDTAVPVAALPARTQAVRAALQGFQGVPPISTSGSGGFAAIVSEDDASNDFALEHSNLKGDPVLAAHIHLGPVCVTGGIVIHLWGPWGSRRVPRRRGGSRARSPRATWWPCPNRPSPRGRWRT